MSMNADVLKDLTFYRGRVALAEILRALGISTGDVVATQAFTCVAVPEAIVVSGATPRFIDIEADGINLDVHDLRRKWDDKIRAIIIQHTFGIPANMQPILEFAKEKNVPVIEDCCHTVSSTYKAQSVGTFGIAAFYSFEWGKPIVAGIGGAAVVNDDGLRKKIANRCAELKPPPLGHKIRLALQYRAFQLLYRPRFYWAVRRAFHTLSRIGFAAGNYQSSYETDLQSPEYGWQMTPQFRRRLHVALANLNGRKERQLQMSAKYSEAFRGGPSRLPASHENAESVFVRFPQLVTDKARLLARAEEQRIELAGWYEKPVHPLSLAQASHIHYESGSCPVAEARSNEIVSLPINSRVDDRYIDRVAELITKAA